MFNVGGGEILVILLVALLVLGPEKLPEAARSAGKLYRQVRQLSTGFQQEFREALDDGPAPARRAVHPDAGRGPSLPPLPASPAGTEAATTPSSDDTDRPGAEATAPPADRSTPDEPGATVHVEGPGASFS